MWENALVFWVSFAARLLLISMCIATLVKGNYPAAIMIGFICLIQFLFVESQVRDPRFCWVDSMNKTLTGWWDKIINFVTGFKP